MLRIFHVYVSTAALVLLLSEAVLLVFCYVASAFLVLDVDPSVWLLTDGGLLRIAAPVLAILLGLHFLDLYSKIDATHSSMPVLEIGQAIGFAFVVEAILSYLGREMIPPRQLMLVGSGSSLLLLSGWRTFYGLGALRALPRQRLLFLGTDAVIGALSAHLLQYPELGYVNLGYIDSVHPPGTLLHGAKVIGPLEELRRHVAELRPDRLVTGMAERRQRMPMQDLLDLHFSGLPIEEAVVMFEAVRGRLSVEGLRPSQLVFSAELGPQPGRLLWHNVLSFLLALVATGLALPLLVIVAVAVKLSSPGPILYRQKRVGLHGRIFDVLKFRTMYVDAEAKTGAVWAAEDDPRVTSAGRWLRRLRLDELPQLWNVLRGEMAIVGPRPERPEFVRVLAQEIPFYHQRHCVRPGITGWAQINYKYGDTVQDTIIKLEYDLYYVKHLSQSLDLYILFQTVKAVLLTRGSR